MKYLIVFFMFFSFNIFPNSFKLEKMIFDNIVIDVEGEDSESAIFDNNKKTFSFIMDLYNYSFGLIAGDIYMDFEWQWTVNEIFTFYNYYDLNAPKRGGYYTNIELGVMMNTLKWGMNGLMVGIGPSYTMSNIPGRNPSHISMNFRFMYQMVFDFGLLLNSGVSLKLGEFTNAGKMDYGTIFKFGFGWAI